ncbi:DnaJ-class molecular chaperone [Phycicoccus badiiscoriae]|uniref:DnaJ-class molecular chaperone n=1 Tax=Pedococcus badiiscoriae TaxID=642776 RepID=A0A852WKE9_9MICO|nr:J domain-containing protein [Pedococcus badiiscoriae]NYG05966.1 DnaJ-class molecular chaperone [Pedococcus badiiscoriae]
MTADQNDPYVVLDVAREATQQQIRHAYLSQLRASHPDTRTPDAPPGDTTVQNVLDAYEILGDPVRRADYDQHTAFRPGATPIRVRVTVHRTPGPPSFRATPVRWHS